MLSDFSRALLDLVLPQTCAGCDAPGSSLCGECADVLRQPVLGVVPDAPPGLPRLATAAAYAGPVRGVLLAHKERGRLALARPLGALLSQAVAALGPPVGTLVVPVPSSRRAVRERGHDHALRLARAAAGATGLRIAPVLRQVRPVADAAGLGAEAREANVHEALRARHRLDAAPVVLVDDIVTTGATLREAARAVRAAGGSVLGAAVVAVTPAPRRVPLLPGPPLRAPALAAPSAHAVIAPGPAAQADRDV